MGAGAAARLLAGFASPVLHLHEHLIRTLGMQRGGRGSLRSFATHTLAADQLTATRPVGRERIARPRQSRLVARPRQTMLARVRDRLLPHVRQLHRACVHGLELGGGELGGALLLSAGALQLHVATDRRAVVRQPAHLLA